MQIITTITIWKVLCKCSLEKCNTTCLELTSLISCMPMNVFNTHILLSTAAIQQIRCREELVLKALYLPMQGRFNPQALYGSYINVGKDPYLVTFCTEPLLMIACFTKKAWKWQCLGILALYRSHKNSTSNKRGILSETPALSYPELASGWTVKGTWNFLLILSSETT